VLTAIKISQDEEGGLFFDERGVEVGMGWSVFFIRQDKLRKIDGRREGCQGGQAACFGLAAGSELGLFLIERRKMCPGVGTIILLHKIE